jgi:ketosteroid isomerase-like protein
MEVSRRHLAAAGALALGASSLLRNSPALAEAADEKGINDAVEALRKAVLAADKTQLMALAAEQVSYGHSDGRVQNKAEFIDGVMTRKAVVKSIDFPELKITMAGNNAVARHIWMSESETDGKPNSVKIGVLAVWTKQDGAWRLLARQGYKLA